MLQKQAAPLGFPNCHSCVEIHMSVTHAFSRLSIHPCCCTKQSIVFARTRPSIRRHTRPSIWTHTRPSIWTHTRPSIRTHTRPSISHALIDKDSYYKLHRLAHPMQQPILDMPSSVQMQKMTMLVWWSLCAYMFRFTKGACCVASATEPYITLWHDTNDT